MQNCAKAATQARCAHGIRVEAASGDASEMWDSRGAAEARGDASEMWDSRGAAHTGKRDVRGIRGELCARAGGRVRVALRGPTPPKTPPPGPAPQACRSCRDFGLSNEGLFLAKGRRQAGLALAY